MKWNQKMYQDYITYLKSCSDQEYKKFHSGLTTTKYEILGVRVPIQRRIAKEITKSDIPSFLELTQNHYYEEVMIKGFVLASIKDKDLLLSYLEEYISLIDNWAICDGFCSSLKIVKTDKAFWFSYLTNYVKTKEVFKIRVGLVLFLNYFISEDYLEKIFLFIDEIQVDSYYVNMAISWLLCECFIKYREKTLNYLLKSHINTFTFNKTISKIKESYRVSVEDKLYLESLRRKKK